jgi:hypothetical protein
MIQCFSKKTAATTGTGTRFTHPFSGTQAWGITQDTHRMFVSAPGTFRNLRVSVASALAAGSSRTFALYHNGSVTALSVTITDGTGTAIVNNTSDEVTVAAGDTIAFGSTLTGTNANVIVNIALEFEGTNTAQSIYGGPHATTGTPTVFHNLHALESTESPSLAIDDGQTVWPAAGTFTRFDIRLRSAPTSTHSRTFTIYKNGTAQNGGGGTPDTRVTITGAATTGTASFSLTASPGDLFAIECSSSGTPAGTEWTHGLAFTATTDGQFAICASGAASFSAIVANFASQSPLHWNNTESNVSLMGTITTFNLSGFRLATAAADNGRTFQFSVNGVNTGPSGTLAGGATTLAGTGSPAAVTSADLWSFETNPGAVGTACILGFLGEAESAEQPGPMTSGPLLRMALVKGGMAQ